MTNRGPALIWVLLHVVCVQCQETVRAVKRAQEEQGQVREGLSRVNVAASSAGGSAWAVRNQERDGFVIAAAIDNDMSSSNAWAFDGGLSDALAIFSLGSTTNSSSASTAANASAAEASRMRGVCGVDVHTVDEIVLLTALGRADHHITMFRLWSVPPLLSSPSLPPSLPSFLPSFLPSSLSFSAKCLLFTFHTLDVC